MLGILFDIAGAVLSGQEMNESMEQSDRRKQEAISQSNKATLGRVAGIAALGAAAAFGISKLADDKKIPPTTKKFPPNVRKEESSCLNCLERF